jgi:hypothetical protein
MCYGAYCRGYGSTLTWDTSSNLPPGWTPLIRKVNAGCYVGVEDNGTGIVGQEDRCQREGMACSICVDIGEDARKYLLYSAPLHFCLEDANSLTKRPL